MKGLYEGCQRRFSVFILLCPKKEISGIFVKSIAKGSAADMCGQIRVNDQIIEVDGRPLHGYTNHDAVEVLRNTGKSVKLRLARYLRGAKYQQLQLAIGIYIVFRFSYN
ncbi:patj homolog [Caerostris extrusa]|uniref:Patj homolog n=1 Tax=Caerostris extrusa TaxID=172846 RepID=A0AAV4P314_CAEEX|nr:patj homolog [Caerostris extrusa]